MDVFAGLNLSKKVLYCTAVVLFDRSSSLKKI